MNSVILSKAYSAPPFCEREILRYAGCKSEDSEIAALLKACIEEIKDKLVYKVCFRELPVTVINDVCNFGAAQIKSKNLADNLRDCGSVILFAATVGIELDRLIAKYGRLSPAKGLMLGAIGAERIEALCDVFCEDIAREKNAVFKPRFSPGYGDLPLEVQREIFSLLDCSKLIGISLSDSLLMTPSKSVTAFLGLTEVEKKIQQKSKCSTCNKLDCEYRGAL